MRIGRALCAGRRGWACVLWAAAEPSKGTEQGSDSLRAWEEVKSRGREFVDIELSSSP